MKTLKSYEINKKAFLLHNSRADYKVLMAVIQGGKFLGLYSFNVYAPNKKSSYKAFVLVLLVLYIITLSCSFSKMMDVLNGFDYAIAMFSCTWKIIGALFLMSCTISSKTSDWRQLFYNLEKIEKLMYRFEYKNNKKLVLYFIELASIWTVSIVLESIDLIYWYEVGLLHVFALTFSSTIVHFYMVYCFIIVMYTTLFIRSRYKFLNGAVTRIFGALTQKVEINDDVKKVRNFLTYAEQMTRKLTDVFGWKIFYFITITAMNIVLSIILMVLDNEFVSILKFAFIGSSHGVRIGTMS